MFSNSIRFFWTVESRLFHGKTINYGKIKVFIYVIVLRITLEEEGGSIKCERIADGVFVVCFVSLDVRCC